MTKPDMADADLETTMREGLFALSQQLRPAAPPAEAIFDRAADSSPGSRRVSRRTVGAAVLAGAVLAGSAAAAVGTVPTEVRDMFQTFAGYDEPYRLDPDEARRVASAPAYDGKQIEYWIADVDGGGTCEYVRYVRPDGTDDEPGWSSCSKDPGQASLSPELFAATWSGERQSTAGHAPKGTTVVLVTFETKSADVPVTEEGYFVADFDEGEQIRSLEALSADGRVIDRTTYPEE